MAFPRLRLALLFWYLQLFLTRCFNSIPDHFSLTTSGCADKLRSLSYPYSSLTSDLQEAPMNRIRQVLSLATVVVLVLCASPSSSSL